MTQITRRYSIVFLFALVAIGALYGFMMRPQVTGFLYDDGIYLMAAQSLALGKGYVLNGLVGEPALYKYPPLFSAILAPIWLWAPHFPENLFWFKGLNIFLGLLSLGLLFYYTTRCRGFSFKTGIGLMLLLGTNPWFIDSTVELMSEPLFLVLSTLLLVMLTRPDNKTLSLTKPNILFMLLLAVAILYTRSLGIVLISAIGLWLWFQQDHKKTAVIFSALCGLGLLPWLFWSAHQSDGTVAIQDFLVRTFQESYFQSLKMDFLYEYNPLSLYTEGAVQLFEKITLTIFPALTQFSRLNNLGNVFLLLGLSLMGFLIYRSLQSVRKKEVSLAGLYLGLYLFVLPLWSFHEQYPRFLMVILPLLILELIPLFSTYFKTPRTRIIVFSFVLLLSLGTNLYAVSPVLTRAQPNAIQPAGITMPANLTPWEDYTALFQFIQTHTRSDEIVWTDQLRENFLLSLYTQRTTLDHFFFYTQPINKARLTPQALQLLFQQKADVMYQYLQQNSITYLVARYPAGKINPFNPTELLLKRYPDQFKKLFSSPTGQLHLYQITTTKK